MVEAAEVESNVEFHVFAFSCINIGAFMCRFFSSRTKTHQNEIFLSGIVRRFLGCDINQSGQGVAQRLSGFAAPGKLREPEPIVRRNAVGEITWNPSRD
jgi:hypothetical protein